MELQQQKAWVTKIPFFELVLGRERYVHCRVRIGTPASVN